MAPHNNTTTSLLAILATAALAALLFLGVQLRDAKQQLEQAERRLAQRGGTTANGRPGGGGPQCALKQQHLKQQLRRMQREGAQDSMLLHGLAKAAAVSRRPRPSRANPPCTCSFLRYTPSALERRWTTNVQQWQKEDPCVSNASATRWLTGVVTAQHAEVRTSNAREAELRGTGDAQTPLAQSELQAQVTYDTRTLSTMTYTRRCGGPQQAPTLVHVPIEPIAGISRDPRKCQTQMSEEYTQSKEYLLPLSMAMAACPALHAPGIGAANDVLASGSQQAFLFDAGATLEGLDSGLGKRWTGTSWIVDWYRSRGVQFDHVYGWEPRRRNVAVTPLEKQLAAGASSGQRDAATNALTKGLRFFDRGVSDAPDSFWNPLAMIKSLTRPEDLVVFKLDIDTEDIELGIVRQLLQNAELRGLVDEFYFEYHLHNKVMRMHNLGERGMTAENDLASWYKMVVPARQAGLRMHMWP